MTNLARFWLNNSPPEARGFDVTAETGDVYAHLYESASNVVSVSYHVRPASPLSDSPRATAGAPALTIDNGTATGSAISPSTPTASVEITGFPSSHAVAHMWELVCLVNGGVNARGAPDPDYRFSRFIAFRNDVGLRKVMEAERDEYDPIESWASAVNDLLSLASGTPSTQSAAALTLWAEDFDEVAQGWYSSVAAGIAFDAVATNLVIRTLAINEAIGFTHFVPSGVTSVRISLTYRPEAAFVSSGSFTVLVAAKGLSTASWPNALDHETLTLPVADGSTSWVSEQEDFLLSDLGITADGVASFDMHLTARSEAQRLLLLCARVEFA